MKSVFSLALLVLFLFSFSSCGNAPPEDTVYVPILMYHDFASGESSGNSFTVPLSRFEEHLTALTEAGYTSVTFADLIGFVYFGGSLPEKPVLLTADDGYTNVVELAASCAGKYGMTISCAVIGTLEGKNGHFSFDGFLPENLEIVSHTFALHDRNGAMGMIAHGIAGSEFLLADDIAKMREACGSRFPMTASVLVYPHGSYSAESERIFSENGYSVTVTCDSGIAEIRRGEPESLYLLPRLSVWRNTTAEELMEIVNSE